MVYGKKSVTEVTRERWFSRIGKAFGGIGTGLMLIVVATCLLYWNEGRSVRTGDTIAEARRATVNLPDVTRRDPAFDGQTVHVTGRAVTEEELTDPLFGIKAAAIALRRRVEFYQWVEEATQEKRTKLGGDEETVTTYTYSTQWVGSPVDSQRFRKVDGHENTIRLRAGNETLYADHVTLGAYRLPEFLSHSIGGEKALQLAISDEERLNLQKILFPREPVAAGWSGYAEKNTGESLRNPAALLHTLGNTMYIGRRPDSPDIGDVRVTFSEVRPAEVSVIAKVSGDTFVPFHASNGENFFRLAMGKREAQAMFDDARSANETTAWLLRALGVLLCVAGIRMVLTPVRVIADILPLLGTIAGAGTGLAALLLGVSWSVAVIAIAWLRFRPLLGGILLGVACLLLVCVFLKGRGKKTATSVSTER